MFARVMRKIKVHVANRFTATKKKTWRIIQLQPSFSCLFILFKHTIFNYYHDYNGDISSMSMKAEQTPSVEGGADDEVRLLCENNISVYSHWDSVTTVIYKLED